MSFNYGGQSYDNDGLPIDPRQKANEDVWQNLSGNGGYQSQNQPYAATNPTAPYGNGNSSANPYGQQLYGAMQPQQSQNLPTNAVPQYARELQSPYGVNQPPKSQIAAAVLAFFLGEFGVHNFYLGYTQRGATQLVLTITGLVLSFVVIGVPIVFFMAVWAFVEFIQILLRSGRYGFDAYGRRLE